MAYAAVAFRFALASLFLTAGAAKLPRRRDFEQAVRNYRLLPGRLVWPVARVLPMAEVACGALLALGLATRVVAGLLAAALCAFTAAVAINLLRGREIDCGCFGPVAARRIGWTTVARNLILVGGAIVVVLEAPKAFSLDGLIAAGESDLSTSAAAALLIAATLAVFAFSIAQEALTVRRLARSMARLGAVDA